MQRPGGDLIENVMGVEGPVIVADSRVITSDQQMRAAVILPEQGMKQRLARAGVTHIQRITRMHDRIRDEVVCDQCVYCPGPDGCGNVTRLQTAQQ